MITYRAEGIKDPNFEYDLVAKWHNIETFIETYKNWIITSKNNCVTGLNNLSAYVTDGVTGAFSDFEKSYKHLETCVFRGEYPYHHTLGIKSIDNLKELSKQNKLIISYPFSAHGNKHEHFDDIIDYCNLCDIPVFLDMAFFGTCANVNIDVHQPCIKFVAFSLSKTFVTGFCRTGICFTNEQNIAMKLINEYYYVNHVSLGMHTNLLKNFSADYVYNKYRSKQIKICNEIDFEPSDTVFLGYSFTNKTFGKKYSREGYVNRVGLNYVLLEDNYNLKPIPF